MDTQHGKSNTADKNFPIETSIHKGFSSQLRLMKPEGNSPLHGVLHDPLLAVETALCLRLLSSPLAGAKLGEVSSELAKDG